MKSANGKAPRFLRSWVAMWALTATPIVVIFMACFDVGRAYEVWINGWPGIVAAVGTLMGVKMGKDMIVEREVAKQGSVPESVGGVVPGD